MFPSIEDLSRFGQEFGEGFQVVFITGKQISCKKFELQGISLSRLLNIGIKLVGKASVQIGCPALNLVLLLGLAGQHQLICLLLIDIKMIDLFWSKLIELDIPLLRLEKNSFLFPEQVVLVVKVNFFFLLYVFLQPDQAFVIEHVNFKVVIEVFLQIQFVALYVLGQSQKQVVHVNQNLFILARLVLRKLVHHLIIALVKLRKIVH